MDNPQTLQEKIDAASNLVAQIGLALNIGDVSHAKNAQKKALDLLMSVLMSGELDTE